MLFLYFALTFLAGMFLQWFLDQPIPHVDHPAEEPPPATDTPRPLRKYNPRQKGLG